MVLGLTLFGWGVGGSGDPNFFLNISSSWVKRSFHAEFELSRLFRSGSFMVVEVGAVAKADQKDFFFKSTNKSAFVQNKQSPHKYVCKFSQHNYLYVFF